jgi:hypothetical protein
MAMRSSRSSSRWGFVLALGAAFFGFDWDLPFFGFAIGFLRIRGVMGIGSCCDEGP